MTTRDVWLLIGQSNMEGCGLLRDSLESDPRIWNFSSAGSWETARDPLHRLWESYTPVNQELMRANFTTDEQRALSNEEYAAAARRDYRHGGGLGVSFGIAMANATGREIGLLSAAHGGTSLEQWNPIHKSRGESSLYGALLSRIERALADCPNARIRGALWYQGESDANENDAKTYAARLQNLVETLRADLQMPQLPFVAVQLGCFRRTPAETENVVPPEKHWDEVREAISQLPQLAPHCATVSAIDLGLSDPIHIGTPGLTRLGKRLAWQAISLSAGGQDIAPRVATIESVPEARGLGTLRLACENVVGGWNPRENISGFSLHTPDGAIHPNQTVIVANAAPDDARAIELLLSAPPDENLRVGYGLGFAPYANAVDNRDMALPAFLPRAVEM